MKKDLFQERNIRIFQTDWFLIFLQEVDFRPSSQFNKAFVIHEVLQKEQTLETFP